MIRYYGANHDLDRLITTHLFIICPNNSGSTFLKNALATSKITWNLKKEGQHTFGFVGPSTRSEKAGLIWASNQRWLDIFQNAIAYNWTVSRKAWYFQAFSLDPEACIFVIKSPPFLLNVAELQKHFSNARFIFMVRNPYAVVEGIYRRHITSKSLSPDEILTIAAQHIMTCFEYQKPNIENYSDCGTFFTYEKICDKPTLVEKQIRDLVPELDDLKLLQRIPVKGTYDEVLRDMNEQQIMRLTANDLDCINQVFIQHQDLLAYFGYQLQTEVKGESENERNF